MLNIVKRTITAHTLIIKRTLSFYTDLPPFYP